MERRVILAIVLMLIVAVLPSILFPPKKRSVGRTVGRPDGSTHTSVPSTRSSFFHTGIRCFTPSIT